MRESEKIDQVLDIISDLLESADVTSEHFADYMTVCQLETVEYHLNDLSDYFTSKGK